MELIGEARKIALEVKEKLGPTRPLDIQLDLTSVRLGSVSQIDLFNPALQAPPDPVERAEAVEVDLTLVRDSIRSNEIDFRTLKEHITQVLKNLERASVADILVAHPATQGLGSVVGLLHLAHRHGERGTDHEMANWEGLDGVWRQARIDTWYFIKERIDELVY
jgi:hypothetical protein